MMNDRICTACGSQIATESGMLCRNCKEFKPRFDTIKITVLLDKITDIRDFVNLVSKCRDDVVVESGHYAVNAKSIMALFSLDLSKPLTVEFYGSIPYDVEEGIKKLIID